MSNASLKAGISFYVFRKDGSKNPDIFRFFLEPMNVTAQDAAEGKLTLADRTEWVLILEERTKRALLQEHFVKCIVSFQVRSSGNWAIARLFDDRKLTKTNTNKEITE